MSDPIAMREMTRGEILDQRNHYLAGCTCPLRPTCVPHAWAGLSHEYHTICADHDHAERRSGVDRRAGPLSVPA